MRAHLIRVSEFHLHDRANFIVNRYAIYFAFSSIATATATVILNLRVVTCADETHHFDARFTHYAFLSLNIGKSIAPTIAKPCFFDSTAQ